ncbi:hypothetical protein B0T17DRAFT_620037 [Bombardia bombarda]|uniref:NACHT domain-containing protein n=1 Tax=Bombardia bombarda TaxID=252184 RepID=A0AA39WH18_9PEZI|nr:hypothetical protein B0T17DRAFT_620037 [Bombardia bombarda]
MSLKKCCCPFPLQKREKPVAPPIDVVACPVQPLLQPPETPAGPTAPANITSQVETTATSETRPPVAPSALSQTSSYQTAPTTFQQDLHFVTREIWAAAYGEVKRDTKLLPLVSNYEEFFDTILWPNGLGVNRLGPTPGVNAVSMSLLGTSPGIGTDAMESGHEYFKKVSQLYMETSIADNQGIISSAIHFVQSMKDAVSGALSVSPPASLAWAGVCLVILPIILNHAEQISARQAGFSYVMSRLKWYDQIIDLLNRDHWKSQHKFTMLRQGIRDEIVGLYKLLIEYQLRTYYAYCRPVATFSKDILKLDDWDGMISGIKRAESKLQDYMNLNFEQHVLDKLHVISEDALRKQRKEVITRFKFPDELPYKVYQAYLDSIESPDEGTGLADSGLFILEGIPGSGKSVIAKSMLTELPKWRPTTVCTFFFKDNGRGQNMATTALCRVLDQMFKHRIALVDKIASNVEHLLAEEVRYNLNLLWTTLDTSTRDAEPGEFTIVLDALDECTPECAERLCAKIDSYLSGPAPKLKFFITTRPLIHQPFKKKYTTTVESNEDQYCLDHLRSDIENVVATRFEQFAKTCIHDEDLKKELLALVQPKEERTYLYVKLLFDYINLKVRDGLPRVPRGWIAIFSTLPATVKETYREFLQDVREVHHNDVRTMLQMVVAAARPLTVREINIALNIRDCKQGNPLGLGLQTEDAFQDWILDACRFFLDIYNGRVYFIHQTAKDYLLARSDDESSIKPAWIGKFTIECCHKTLGQSCIAYLSLPIVSKPRFKGAGTPAREEKPRVSEEGYHLWDIGDLEFANYSSSNWHTHAHLGDMLTNNKVADKSDDMYDTRLKILQAWDQGLISFFELDVASDKLDLEAINRLLEPEGHGVRVQPVAYPHDRRLHDTKTSHISIDDVGRFIIVDSTGQPLSRVPRTNVGAINVVKRLSDSLRSIATVRTVDAFCNYRNYSPIPLDWFSIRIYNKNRTLDDASFAHFQMYDNETFSYVISNKTSSIPVYVHILCLNASWTVGTLLWNVRIPPMSEKTGDLTMTIPRKVNDDDGTEIEDKILVIFRVGEQYCESYGITEEWLRRIYVPPVIVPVDGEKGAASGSAGCALSRHSCWLPFVPPPSWQVRYFTVRTVPRVGKTEEEEEEEDAYYDWAGEGDGDSR